MGIEATSLFCFVRAGLFWSKDAPFLPTVFIADKCSSATLCILSSLQSHLPAQGTGMGSLLLLLLLALLEVKCPWHHCIANVLFSLGGDAHLDFA